MDLTQRQVRTNKDRAVNYIAKRKYRAATKCLHKVLNVTPEDSWVTRKIAECYEHLGDYYVANYFYDWTAKLFLRTGHHRKAIAMYQKILKLDPFSRTFKTRLAEAQKEWAESQEILKKSWS
jgi:tetratricopeptide (TPR) repeat protein